MGFLSQLLPALREVRSPVVAGYLLLGALWLCFGDRLPEPVDLEDGSFLHLVHRASETVGPVGGAVGVTLLAWTIGTVAHGSEVLARGLIRPTLGLAGQIVLLVASPPSTDLATRLQEFRQSLAAVLSPTRPGPDAFADGVLDSLMQCRVSDPPEWVGRYADDLLRKHSEIEFRQRVQVPLAFLVAASTWRMIQGADLNRWTELAISLLSTAVALYVAGTMAATTVGSEALAHRLDGFRAEVGQLGGWRQSSPSDW